MTIDAVNHHSSNRMTIESTGQTTHPTTSRLPIRARPWNRRTSWLNCFGSRRPFSSAPLTSLPIRILDIFRRNPCSVLIRDARFERNRSIRPKIRQTRSDSRTNAGNLYFDFSIKKQNNLAALQAPTVAAEEAPHLAANSKLFFEAGFLLCL